MPGMCVWAESILCEKVELYQKNDGDVQGCRRSRGQGYMCLPVQPIRVVIETRDEGQPTKV